MKNLNYIFLLLIAISCRAQSPVINLRDWKGENIVNSYIKDAISVFKSEHGENGDENGNYTPAKVPKGTYTLIKQP